MTTTLTVPHIRRTLRVRRPAVATPAAGSGAGDLLSQGASSQEISVRSTQAPGLENAASPQSSVDSALLLGGEKMIQILHNGFVYKLQATKLGKLILTK